MISSILLVLGAILPASAQFLAQSALAQEDSLPIAQVDFPLGDVNCSNGIDAVDALFILQFEVGLRSDTGTCPLADPTTSINSRFGDTNGDGQVGAVDALFIVQCVVGLSNPYCPDGELPGIDPPVTDCAGINVNQAPFDSDALKPAFDPNTAIGNTLRDPRVARAPGLNPHTHGVTLYVPTSEFSEQPLLNCGFLDVTKPPFNAIRNDASQAGNNVDAINRAMTAAREYMLVTYFPTGTYYVNDTLRCEQGLSRQLAASEAGSAFNFREDRNGACHLFGSTRGPRPTIRLADGSFPNANLLEPLLLIWARDNTDDNRGNNPCGGVVDPDNPTCDGKPDNLDVTAPGISFNNMVVGIDFDLGANNAGAVAIDLDGAQGSGIEDVTINARSSYAGLTALPAAGGATHNLTVIGGKYGIDTISQESADKFKDTLSLGSVPTLSGSTFKNQLISAIRYGQLESLSMVGIKVEVRSGNTNPAIQSKGGFWPDSLYSGGVMSLVDTSIEFASFDANNVAIRTFSSVHLNNVYTRNTDTVVIATEPRCGDGPECITPDLKTKLTVNHATGNWHHIEEYAARILPWNQKTSICPNPDDEPLCDPDEREEIRVQYDMPIYLNGSRHPDDFYPAMTSDEPVAAPPGSLQSKHQWEVDFPNWDSGNVINIKLPPYSAAGDGYTDDTAVLQQAITDASAFGKALFLPKGYYRVSQTIQLMPNTRIIGAARHLSHILAQGVPCQNIGVPSPLLRTPQQGGGTARVAFLTINVPWEEACAHPVHWQLGGDNIIRSINIKARSRDTGFIAGMPPTRPQVLINNNGAGRWYTNFRDSRYEWTAGSSNFRWIKVANTVGPFTFYQANPEGQGNGDFAKMEIVNASNITIYGYKDENRNHALRIINSNDIQLFAYGGIGFADPDESLFYIWNSTNVRLVGVVNRANNLFNDGTPTQTPWSMISGSVGGNPAFSQTETFDRPILFLIGD